MTPNPTPLESSPVEPSKAQSGLVNVFRNLGLRNRSGQSIPTPALSLSSSHTLQRIDYLGLAPHNGYELLEKLKKDKPLQDRVSAAESLHATVSEYPSEFVTEIWYNAQDLVGDDLPTEVRHVALKLFTACLKCVVEPSALDRLRFYRTIAQYNHPDDFDHHLQAMLVLTSGGRNLASFEREIAELLSMWLKNLFSEAGKARQLRKREGSSLDSLSGAEFCLKELFKFVTSIIKFNFQTFGEREISQLLSDILSICRKTTDKKDIECSIVFIEALVTYGYIPANSLRSCIEILCGTYANIRDLVDATWNTVSNLCRSHMAHKCIITFLEILKKPAKKPQLPNTNTLRGAVMFLEKLLLGQEEDSLPKIPISLFMSAIQDALSIDSARFEVDVIRTISHIFARPDIVAKISLDEWDAPLAILVHISRRTTERADGASLRRLGVKNVSKARSQDKDMNTSISQSLFEIINQLEQICRRPDFGPIELVVDFFMNVFGHIPDSTAEFVINYYTLEHLCYPSSSDWLENSRRLVETFFKTRTRPSEMRVQVLLLIKDVYETIREVCEEPLLYEPVRVALEDFLTENDPIVLEALVNIVVDVAADSDLTVFSELVDPLIRYVRLDRHPLSTTSGSYISRASSSLHFHGSLVNIVVLGFVKMFVGNINTDAIKTVRIYEELVKIAGCTTCATDARLTSMKCLFSIRADSEHCVYLVGNPEVDYLAGVLNRKVKLVLSTEEKEGASNIYSAKDEETSSSSRSTRSNSVSQSLLFRNPSSRNAMDKYDNSKQRSNPLWSYPEDRHLPEILSRKSNITLLTFYDPGSDFPAKQGPTLDPKRAIRLALWMETCIPIIQQGSDWEIYSYVLCHLPSQLANKTAFRNCKAHIGLLRNYVCDQLHTNRMPSTELPTEVKRADIAVCLIHLLTVLICYRVHFAKNETEGIVKAFQLGLHSWNRTAKPCIHALAVCCYELPQSTSKYLSGILTKLSQIITSPVVSVHILEFLSALAKLPALYSNFTEPDFRNIFGIAFRYIQHARETAAQQSQRSSIYNRANQKEAENIISEQSDLPQYVLTLAYNVLTTWFLSLRLSERPKYVSWIIRGLILHDHSNQVDEQSEACIDMLQRFTFSEHDTKVPRKLDKSSGFSPKNWLNGMTILSIQMAPESGISRVTVRRPAGTSYYYVKPELRGDLNELEINHNKVDEVTHIDGGDLPVVNVLPSHLLLQLAGGTGSSDYVKPLLIPDDDKSRRAIEVFDRIPVVDFHKVGVIYVGMGQTDETEILSNVMGSPDYTEFVGGLGELIPLKGTSINTGGLDHEEDFDGQFMYFWKDRTTEISFHVTTMMPSHEHDPQCTYKKRHIGNDFVNIIFNDSGLPWKFGTIPSQFNFVSIVISPEARTSFVSSRLSTKKQDYNTFYRVQVCCKEGFSDISPAQEPKVVSALSLPSFVRNLALNASIYSHVFNEGGREHISNPRHRLRSIKQLRERIGAPSHTYSLSKTVGHIAQQSNRRISTLSTQTNSTEYSSRSANNQLNGDIEKDYETEDLLASLDFSRYT